MAKKPIEVETLKHTQAKRRNIPTAELQALVAAEDATPKQVRYPRETPLPQGERRPRNPDLDPQLVWRGKDEQDWSDLVVQAPPLYVQEKVHPKAIIADLLRQSQRRRGADPGAQFSFFDDFNGLPDAEAKLEFYAHDQNWSNRFILGDSLQVMASLAEKEGLRGQVQCIYFDPPYGIKFNSNWQVSTRSHDVKDGKRDQITREPEQVKAFRDTWKSGVNSYLTYLRDRLILARDLLSESGSIFLQIGDENVHRVRVVMDEVFGPEQCCSQLTITKTAGQSSDLIAGTADYILWYAKCREFVKFRAPLIEKDLEDDKSGVYRWIRMPDGSSRAMSDDERKAGITADVFRISSLTSQRPPGSFPVLMQGRTFSPGRGYWKTGEYGMSRLIKASRVSAAKNSIQYVRFIDDFRAQNIGNIWSDTGTGNFTDEKVYVVQSGTKVVRRCILMATDPGDLVLDPTCGSGTTATVAEQWGRRWITVDTSRVALALARSRIMGARYPYYLLADSPEGQRKEAEVTRTALKDAPPHGDIRHGFVCERVPHITLKSIANNAEIDVIWDRWQATLKPLRAKLNAALSRAWEEWEVPREPGDPWPKHAAEAWAGLRTLKERAADAAPLLYQLNKQLGRSYTLDTLPEVPCDPWPAEPTQLHAEWWKARIARQKEIDASIAARAEFETLHDKPYTDPGRVRVAGPFTVESLSPHRVVPADEDELWDDLVAAEAEEAGRPAQAARAGRKAGTVRISPRWCSTT